MCNFEDIYTYFTYGLIEALKAELYTCLKLAHILKLQSPKVPLNGDAFHKGSRIVCSPRQTRAISPRRRQLLLRRDLSSDTRAAQLAMDAVDSVVDPLREFSKDSVRLVKRCHKPDRKGKAPNPPPPYSFWIRFLFLIRQIGRCLLRCDLC